MDCFHASLQRRKYDCIKKPIFNPTLDEYIKTTLEILYDFTSTMYAYIFATDLFIHKSIWFNKIRLFLKG